MQENSQKFGLFGKSLKHSFSQKYFTQKFESEGIRATYDLIELDEIDSVKKYFNSDYKGFNVTMPYKTQIIPFLDELSDEARIIGAVNTVANENGKWIGYNTDVFGFQQMIKPFFESHHERALVIGTGGASKAVAYVLENLGVKVIFLSRTPRDSNQFGYQDLNENMIKFNGIIVNASPIGMFPNEEQFIDLPYEALSNRHLVVDLIYNPQETLFLKKAKEQGAKVLNGLTMLHQQAEKAWKIWNKNN